MRWGRGVTPPAAPAAGVSLGLARWRGGVATMAAVPPEGVPNHLRLWEHLATDNS